MEVATIKAQPRKTLGTRHSRRLRSQGELPGVIYGHGEPPVSCSVSSHDLQVHLRHGVRVLTLDLEGKSKQYLIKAVQYDHLNKDPIHFDLARVDLDERVHVKVGIELHGTPKGLSEGGILDQLLDELEIECLALEIPGKFHLPVSQLGVGDSASVKDLELPEGVSTLVDPETKIALVRTLAAEAEVEEEATEEAGSAEPERIGRVAETEEKDTETKS